MNATMTPMTLRMTRSFIHGCRIRKKPMTIPTIALGNSFSNNRQFT